VAALLRQEHPVDPEPCYDGEDSPDFGADQRAEFWGDEEAVAEYIRSELASAPKFAKLLESRGVEVPMKPSPTNPQNQVPALAKTDEEFAALQESDDPLVAAAARARLAVKSTLLETRLQAFIEASDVVDGHLPIPLHYCGADTTGRDSGWLFNPQNMPRITPGKPKVSDALRNCLRAPKGCAVGVADQSGIELRVNHTLWRVPSTMALYQKDPMADLYKDFASFYYGKPPSEIEKAERQFAKVCQLGLGFGAGAATFVRIARLMGGITLTEAEAEAAVSGWRARYSEIVQGWKTSGAALRDIEQGVEREVDPAGLVHTSSHGFHLPSGRIIRYPDLRTVDDEWPDGRPRKSWVYAQGRHKAFLTGPKCVENLVQALARDSVFDCALEFFKLTGLRPALRVHDELVYVFPDADADAFLGGLQALLRAPPKWWPDLVTWSEGDTAPSYGAAK
jgi:hypothetical protein